MLLLSRIRQWVQSSVCTGQTLTLRGSSYRGYQFIKPWRSAWWEDFHNNPPHPAQPMRIDEVAMHGRHPSHALEACFFSAAMARQCALLTQVKLNPPWMMEIKQEVCHRHLALIPCKKHWLLCCQKTHLGVKGWNRFARPLSPISRQSEMLPCSHVGTALKYGQRMKLDLCGLSHTSILHNPL